MRVLVTATLLLAAAAPGLAKRPPGVVVDRVEPGGAAFRAGVQVGDVVLGWQREPSPPPHREGQHGRCESPFDVLDVELEQTPSGPVRLICLRAGRRLEVEMPDGPWRLETRPRLGPQGTRTLGTSRALAGTRGAEEAAAILRAAAGRDGDSLGAAWLLAEAARLAGERGVADDARAQALAAADRAGSIAARIWIHDLRGDVLRTRGRLEGARAAQLAAVAARSALEPDGPGWASSLNALGALAHARGDPGTAERLWRRSLYMTRRFAPGSLAVAASLNNLGIAALRQGKLTEAEQCQLQALAIREEISPDSIDAAQSLVNLGNLAVVRGNLAAAESYFHRALAIRERLEPDSLGLAVTLNNLGGVACMRGDPAAGESFFRRALTIRERIAPDSIVVASTLNNVGVAAMDHGDLASAEISFRRALEIIEKLAPDSFEVARIVGNLGNVAHLRGEFAAAEVFQRRTNAIMERLAPGSLDTARSLNNLAETARELGSLGEAEDLAREALAVIEVLAPGSTEEARTLHNLGQILVDAGRPDAGLDLLSRSVSALETQQEQLGGAPEEHGAFRAQHLIYYRALIDLLLELERPQTAFHVLERSRARTLLAILAERSLVFSTDLPDELELERQSLRDAGHRVVERLRRLSTTDRDQIATLRDELHRLHQEQARIRNRVRAVSPRLAALTYPQPLSLEAAREALDPGTLLLVYSLGHGTSHLFAVSSRDEGLAVFDLATSEEEVREATDRYRRLVLRHDSEALESSTVAGELADRLLRTAMDSVSRAERVLIVPDGPLHLLPFAALASHLATGDRHLVEIRPLTSVASATVFGELIRERGTESERHVVAFGDPDYRAAGSVDAPALLACAVRDGLRLDPLPATRAEVKAIGGLYGNRAQLWLGAEATEERASSVGGRVSILHFAAHGLIDERFPLESALVLTIPRTRSPAHEDGLLQAWEVFERLRIDADLVTLSSCDAALGEEVAGEGVIGLTRAFQYAGARTVLASLWSVADVSTAELMRRFYTFLEGGDSKDVALQRAQIEFIRGPVEVEIDGVRAEHDLSHPFHWAAFQLIGDWR